MARFLLCWEMGGGLGHAGRLKALSEALLARGHHVDLVLRELVLTHTLLRDLPVRRLQAPMWTHQTVGLPQPPISLTEIMLAHGYLKAEALDALVAGWLSLVDLTGPDLIVADYAPTATLAARVRGVPVATVGSGFSLPPDQAPLPPFRRWDTQAIHPGRVPHNDRLALGVVNEVLRGHGAAPFDRLAQVFRGDQPLLCTWPELDHYPRSAPLEEPYLGPTSLATAGEAPQWPQGPGPRVFAYLRSQQAEHLAVLQALADLGCQTLCYLPEVAAGKAPPVTSPHIHYAQAPVNLAEALPQARLTVCHAGEATLAQAILAGTPLLMLPTQAEQFQLATRLEAAGVGLNAARRPTPVDLRPLLSALLTQPAHALAARALAQKYQGFTHDGQTAALVNALESLVPGA